MQCEEMKRNETAECEPKQRTYAIDMQIRKSTNSSVRVWPSKVGAEERPLRTEQTNTGAGRRSRARVRASENTDLIKSSSAVEVNYYHYYYYYHCDCWPAPNNRVQVMPIIQVARASRNSGTFLRDAGSRPGAQKSAAHHPIFGLARPGAASPT